MKKLIPFLFFLLASYPGRAWAVVASYIYDAYGNPIGSSMGSLDVNLTSGATITIAGASTNGGAPPTGFLEIGGQDGTPKTYPFRVDSSGRLVTIETDGAGTIIDPRGRIWDLSESTDSVSSWLFDGLGTALHSTANALNVAIQNATLAITQSGNWLMQLEDGSGNAITSTSNALDVNVKSQTGNLNTNLHDGTGTAVTSQANGSQQALDVGVNVAGAQVDPRSIRPLTSGDTVTVVQPTGSNLHTQLDAGAAYVGDVGQHGAPWADNLSQITGATPDATAHYLPARITNGAAYVDPTQIRSLSSATDSVVAAPAQVASATLTAPANSASSFAVLASNASRTSVTIFNDSATTCDIAFTSTATTSAFTIQLISYATFIMNPPIYTGAISAICLAASGNLRVTEY